MADFEPPSFSLGLDCDLFDSEPQIAPETRDLDPSSSNQSSVPFATFENKHDEFETLVVDDSEPEYPDSHPNLYRLRRGLTIRATSSSSSPVPGKATAEVHSTAVIDDEDILGFTGEDFCSNCLNPYNVIHKTDFSFNQLRESNRFRMIEIRLSTSCNNMVFPKLIASPVRGFQSIDSDSDDSKCNGSDSNSNHGKYDLPQHVTRMQNVSKAWGGFPKAYRYLFHDDPRIQELVRSRLPNFAPLGNMLNVDLEQPGTSKIDYMGQFSFDESSKQAARTIKDKKSSTSRKISRKSQTEEMSQGWVNPKLGVEKVTTKGAAKRKAHAARQITGHWLTGSDGKKVYVGKSGQELTGRVAYMQYKKESGLVFKKVKRKSASKKKK
ncbi:hypothetical protein SSX86_024427 [Deinandra increscens subsp. villosa]|uniref:Uncharacterized protein n=1 Tax=Deinandra increscens subsp. villosa TaxID=3103831 RepID=A0AAP0GRV5_9ASTR